MKIIYTIIVIAVLLLLFVGYMGYFSSYDVEEKEIETSAWVKCFRQSRPIDKIALYVPWWNAALFSTVLMLSIPAKIAWCEDITLLTPPDKDWNISPEIAYCANKCCINTIIKLGWAQAIWAVSIWTESITKVDKIFGPWNSYVTAAKLLSQNKYWISIDMPAGPSEVLIIWDQNSNPSFIASDLLSQAEHWPDSQAILILIWDQNLWEINNEINKQLKTLARKNYAQKSLEESFILIVENAKQALNFSNNYAPEHLIINLKNPKQYISKIKNAWSVFLWEFTPESAWDYASGTNHTLPTSWFAKTYSWISVDSFIKKITFQEISKDWLTKLWNTITKMAEKEWLDAHKNAVTIRLND